MSTLRLIKSMKRSLTAEEQKAIVKYWSENKKLSSNKVADLSYNSTRMTFSRRRDSRDVPQPEFRNPLVLR